jgi:GGDEF domain-containing protein
MRAPFEVASGVYVNVTTSVGIAFWREPQTREGLLMEADTAMYAAKAKGKNSYYVAPDLDVLPPQDQA